ncbi:hypothetical protein THIOKS12640024 [Thiocapsa sp. KS1]|nr:hypothetical protein THIOKS12640024 [Thiocapsa sp. KS1]
MMGGGLKIRCRFGSAVVMKTTGDDDQLGVGRAVDQAMGVVDATRPVARQIAAQGLRLAGPGERLASGVRDQTIDSFERFSVLLLPVKVSIPSVGDEADPAHDQPPSASSKVRGWASPA